MYLKELFFTLQVTVDGSSYSIFKDDLRNAEMLIRILEMHRLHGERRISIIGIKIYRPAYPSVVTNKN